MNNSSKRWIFLALFLVLVVTTALISAKYYSSAAGVNARSAGQTQVSPEPYKPTKSSFKKAAPSLKEGNRKQETENRKDMGIKLPKKGVSPEPYKPQTQNTRGVSPEPYQPTGVSPEPYKPAGVSPEPY